MIDTPAPVKYETTKQIGQKQPPNQRGQPDFKANAQQRIRSQPKWHQQIQTVPSIPDKTQVFFIAEDEEEFENDYETF